MGDGDGLDGVIGEDGDEFSEVGFEVIEFRAGDGEGFSGEELLMEIGESEGGAIGGDEEMGVLPDGA